MVGSIDIINHWQKVVSEYSYQHELKNGFAIKEEDVMRALYLFVSDRNEIDWIGDIWDQMYGVQDIEGILNGFDFGQLNYCIETSVELIPMEFRLNRKVRIKSRGVVWIIHRYDKDPFPSNPHGHNLESNIKLHLGNGMCYEKRKFIYSINKRDLIDIREKILKKIELELPRLEV